MARRRRGPRTERSGTNRHGIEMMTVSAGGDTHHGAVRETEAGSVATDTETVHDRATGEGTMIGNTGTDIAREAASTGAEKTAQSVAGTGVQMTSDQDRAREIVDGGDIRGVGHLMRGMRGLRGEGIKCLFYQAV